MEGLHMGSEAQMAAFDEKGAVADAFVLDISYRSVLMSVLPQKARIQYADWSDEDMAREIALPDLDRMLAGRIACQKASESPGGTRWDRERKSAALDWMAANWSGSVPWNDFCKQAAQRFKMVFRDVLEEYEWFSGCLFLKQMLDFISINQGRRVRIVPVAPLEEES